MQWGGAHGQAKTMTLQATLLRLIGIITLLTMVMVPSLSRAQSTQGAANAIQFRSARQCAQCHSQIVKEWQGSYMAQAWSNPLFQAEFNKFLKQQGVQHDTQHPSRAACLRCHAPAAVLGQDLALRQEVSREGVTCEICHRVGATREHEFGVNLSMDPNPDHLYSRLAPSSGLAPSPHVLRPSTPMSTSQLCGGCHMDIERSTGLALERTYLEWKASSFGKQGVNCAACHMPASAASLTTQLPSQHASHRFQGGHASSSLLPGTALLGIQQTGPATLTVTVSNVKAGHHFPTGGAHPSRAILLVDVQWPANPSAKMRTMQLSKTYQHDTRAARRPGADAGETPDTTLAPGEHRVETFPLPRALAGAKVTATLNYHLLPDGLAAALMDPVRQRDYAPTKIHQTSKQFDITTSTNRRP
jgi:hypothetical protein